MTTARDIRPSRALLTALVFVIVLQLAAQCLPLPPAPDLSLASTYGVHDNRRLLLRYAALVVAFLLLPWLSRCSPVVTAKPAILRSWRRSLLFSVPIALVGFWLFFGPGIPMSAVNGHEMVHLGYLSQMENGAVLNVDTFMNYGPLLGMSVFGFMKVAGFHLVGFRWYWHATALVGWSLVALVAWRHLRSPLLAVFLILFALLYTPTVLFLPDQAGFYHAAWGWANPLRHGLPVLCLVLLANPLLWASRWAVFVAGAFVAATTFYAQETGVASLIALGALSFWGARRHHMIWTQLCVFTAGCGVALLLVSFPALVRGELGLYLRATFEAPRIVLEGAANKPFPAIGGLSTWPYYILAVVMLGLLWWHGLRVRAGSEADVLPYALSTYGSIAFVTVLVRADRSHLLNVALCFWVLVFLNLDRLERFRSVGLRSPKRIALGATLLLPLAFLPPGLSAVAHALQGRLVHPEPPVGWTKLTLKRGGIWVPGSEWFDGEPQNHGDVRGVALIDSLSASRPTLILGSQASLYYFLTGVRAAVPYTDLATQGVTEYHRRRFIATYFKNRPDYTFMFTEFESHPPQPATGYRRLGERYGLGVYQREDLRPVALP